MTLFLKTVISVKSPTIYVYVYFCSEFWKLSLTWFRMVKLFQILPADAEYFGLLLVKKTVIYKVTRKVTKGVFFTSVYYEIPNFCEQTMVLQLWNWLQVSDG